MTYYNTDGPLGLQGRHTWWATTSDQFTMNDLAYGLPVAQLDRITGLFSLPEIEDLRDPVVGADFEVIYPSFRRGKTITYEGRICAATGESLNQYRWEMFTTFSDRTNEEGTMHINPHPTWGTGYWTFTGRVLTLDIDDEYLMTSMDSLPSPYQLHFILSIRSKDGVLSIHS